MKPKDPFDRNLVFDGLLFATPLYRCRFIGSLVRHRSQWLKNNPGVWKRVEDVLRETASPRCAEISAEAAAAGPSSYIPSDILKDHKDADDAASSSVLEGGPLPADSPALTMESEILAPLSVSHFEDEIAIDGQRFVSAERLASMWGISRKTLSRRIAAGKVPPKIKIGKKLYFEVSAIPEGLASDGSEQAPPTNNEARWSNPTRKA